MEYAWNCFRVARYELGVKSCGLRLTCPAFRILLFFFYTPPSTLSAAYSHQNINFVNKKSRPGEPDIQCWNNLKAACFMLASKLDLL